jgi:thymidylate synthase (FAD)
MKIIEPSVELWAITPNAEQLIERAGRVAWQSEPKEGADATEKFIRMIMGKNHGSVLEHASATLSFIMDRGVSHETVRHRVGISFTQESTRYVSYDKGKHGSQITVVRPPMTNVEEVDAWDEGVKAAEESYMRMIAAGSKPQIARSVLPTCTKTQIVVSANFRAWIHFFGLRCAPDAHPQMQQVAKMALKILWKECPAVFGPALAKWCPEE